LTVFLSHWDFTKALDGAMGSLGTNFALGLHFCEFVKAFVGGADRDALNSVVLPRILDFGKAGVARTGIEGLKGELCERLTVGTGDWLLVGQGDWLFVGQGDWLLVGQGD
jgi:hypothetical protein